MTPSGHAIQRNLAAFVGRWSGYGGSERGEAQTFLNELVASYGTDPLEAGVEFEVDRELPDEEMLALGRVARMAGGASFRGPLRVCWG